VIVFWITRGAAISIIICSAAAIGMLALLAFA